MKTNAGAIPALTTLTVDAPSLRSIELRARPVYISTRHEPLEVPRLSMSLPTPASEKRTAFLASRQSTPLASNSFASSVAGEFRWVIDAGLDAYGCRRAGSIGGRNMDCFKRDGRCIDQIHMAVETAV